MKRDSRLPDWPVGEPVRQDRPGAGTPAIARPGLTVRLRLLLRMFLNVRSRYGTAGALWLGVNELLFDLLHGTATSLEFRRSERGHGPADSYESSNPVLLSRLLNRLPAHARKGAFLDYGAGKGRALLIAARHGFRMAIGIEISPELHATAVRNLRISSRRHLGCTFEVHRGDAAAFEIPDHVTVAYFFNPFGRDVMLAAIGRILESLRRTPREFHIVYLNPVLGDLLVASGFVPLRAPQGEGTIFRYSPAGWSR
jgi:SAM-dependent methyltransferase